MPQGEEKIFPSQVYLVFLFFETTIRLQATKYSNNKTIKLGPLSQTQTRLIKCCNNAIPLFLLPSFTTPQRGKRYWQHSMERVKRWERGGGGEGANPALLL